MPIGKDHFFVKSGPSLTFLPTYFGNESDGDANFDGTATVAGISLGANSYGRMYADGNPSNVIYPTPLKTGSYFYEATVQNKSGSYDGDGVLLQYSSLTIAANYVLTTDQPCRCMMVLVNGDCTINGSLSMTARGANKNPTTSGGANSGGIILPVKPSGSSGLSQSLSPGADFTGFGTAIEAIESEFPSSGTGALLNIPRLGMPASSTNDSGEGNTWRMHNGDDADNYTVTSSWGTRATDVGKTGEGGAGMTKNAVATGGAGGCFSGGSGSGGRYGPSSGGASTANGFGGAGTNGNNTGDWSCSGGAGNPGGSETGGSYVAVDGGDGVGGTLILLVQGNLTIGSGGGIYARGVGGGSGSGGNSMRGGSSGGGTMIVGYAGTLSNSGTVDAEGGQISTADNGGTTSGKDPGYGGVASGGDGSVQLINLNA